MAEKKKAVKKRKVGRPKGATTLPKITDHMTKKQLEDLVCNVLERAQTSDKLAVFILEQHFGKARQTTTLEGNAEKPIPIMQI